MAVSGISSSTVSNYQDGPLAQFRQTFMQMTKAIKSEICPARNKDNDLLSQMQTGTPASDKDLPSGPALSQIGQALQNGDISGAQQALDALTQQAQGTRHHHHHHHANSGDAGTSAPATTPPSASSGNTVNLIRLSAIVRIDAPCRTGLSFGIPPRTTW